MFFVLTLLFLVCTAFQAWVLLPFFLCCCVVLKALLHLLLYKCLSPLATCTNNPSTLAPVPLILSSCYCNQLPFSYCWYQCPFYSTLAPGTDRLSPLVPGINGPSPPDTGTNTLLILLLYQWPFFYCSWYQYLFSSCSWYQLFFWACSWYTLSPSPIPTGTSYTPSLISFMFLLLLVSFISFVLLLILLILFATLRKKWYVLVKGKKKKIREAWSLEIRIIQGSLSKSSQTVTYSRT